MAMKARGRGGLSTGACRHLFSVIGVAGLRAGD